MRLERFTIVGDSDAEIAIDAENVLGVDTIQPGVNGDGEFIDRCTSIYLRHPLHTPSPDGDDEMTMIFRVIVKEDFAEVVSRLSD